MRFIRQRIVLRTFCIFAALVFSNSLLFPSISYALTTGPHQPEYTSYEDSSASDMVNLLTGDFTYNMPILTVPIGNESSFTVPLSYHAGIATDQEASWVGLGWNVNVGSITRTINGFPDDASGESQTINVKDMTDRRGWYSNFPGWAMGWDSQAGHYGTISLKPISAEWNNGKATVGVGGIYAGKNARVDGIEFAVTVARIAAAVMTQGVSETAALSTNIAMDVSGAIMEQVALASSFSPPAAPSTNGYWQFSQQQDSKLLGLYTNYWYRLNQTRVEDMYGTLFLDKSEQATFSNAGNFADLKMNVNGTAQTSIPQFPFSSKYKNKGAASDIDIDPSISNYIESKSPVLLAYDKFYVNGPGISGGIKPYRLETGSVSVPREMTPNHIRLNPVPFLDYGDDKVPFVYEGSMANRYFHHVGYATEEHGPFFHYGMGSAKESGTGTGDNKDVLRYDLNDITLSGQRMGEEVEDHKKLAQGNFIAWLTNAEIKNTTGGFSTSSFMDYFPANNRAGFRQSYQFGGRSVYYGTSAVSGLINLSDGQGVGALAPNQIVDVNVVTDHKDDEGNVIYMTPQSFPSVTVSSVSGTQIQVNNAGINVNTLDGHVEIISHNEPKPANMIGGFVITSSEGMNYHFALPVYDYDFLAKTFDKIPSPEKSSTISRPGQFANTWLLTAITGPDFIDRGGAHGTGDGYIDENDWGYWIKFNYGNHSSDYMWRLPYEGRISDSRNKDESYAQGFKEKYYLNSIETRSHVALFIKDSRADAKDASEARKPSLRLREIALITKDNYAKLTDPAGEYQLQNCSGKTDVLYAYAGANAAQNISGSRAAFVQANAIKRVVFNTDYTLCPGALNSEGGQGKLTLKSVSFLGRNNAKVVPDFKFDYANNPAYNRHAWDGWGMYSSTGTEAGNTHKISNVASDAAAWSLTSIESPLGGTIQVDYERDTYASISGEGTYDIREGVSQTAFTTSGNTVELNTTTFAAGDKVKLTGTVEYDCQDDVMRSYPINYLGTVVSNSNGIITLDAPFYNLECTPHTTGYVSVYISKIASRTGGDLRVASIQVNNSDGQTFKTRYLYNDDDGNSTGVVSVEPDYIRFSDYDYDFYDWRGYPATPVMYGKVSVLSGKLTNDSDFTSKQVYEFETPHRSQYILNEDPVVKNKQLISEYDENLGLLGRVEYYDYSTLSKFEIQRHTAKIGKIKSIKILDQAGTEFLTKNFYYTPYLENAGINNHQGIFSEGTLMHEIVQTGEVTNDGPVIVALKKRYHKGQRTTVLDKPYALSKVVTTMHGHTTEITNKSWDLITGNVLESQSKSNLGVLTKQVVEPLYKISAPGYEEFGSKAVNPSYKNMLNQIAASYLYRINLSGNETGLISAEATVWKKDWENYRVLENGSFKNKNDLYDLNNDGTLQQNEASAQQVWRKHAQYSWIGDYSELNQADGTRQFTSDDKFKFSDIPANNRWKKTGTMERFSHQSFLLESADVNGIHASSKLGYNDKRVLASASNAAFEEIAFSGAEDKSSASPLYFGGEVALGSGTVVASPVHTGKNALSLTTGYGFVFKSTGIAANKTYRASVWASNNKGRIYYKINGGTEEIPAPSVSQGVLKKDGTTWYRIDARIDVGNVTSPSIEIGVKSADGTVVFDDFRFQPYQATMSAYVYDPVSLQVTHVLDNNNLFTRYEYNDRGVLVKTYVESVTYGEKMISESDENYKRFYTGQ